MNCRLFLSTAMTLLIAAWGFSQVVVIVGDPNDPKDPDEKIWHWKCNKGSLGTWITPVACRNNTCPDDFTVAWNDGDCDLVTYWQPTCVVAPRHGQSEATISCTRIGTGAACRCDCYEVLSSAVYDSILDC